MVILIFIVTGIATLMLLLAKRKSDSQFLSNIIIAIISGLAFSGIGTYKGCSDGWLSTSIGRQGACSHHGGVESFINLYGVMFLVVSIVLIFILLKQSTNE